MNLDEMNEDQLKEYYNYIDIEITRQKILLNNLKRKTKSLITTLIVNILILINLIFILIKFLKGC